MEIYSFKKPFCKTKKKKNNRKVSFRKNCQIAAGTESFQAKFERLWNFRKFISQEDKVYCLEMAILLNKILIQGKFIFLIKRPYFWPGVSEHFSC
jgi:hypothetical protein